MKINKFRLFEKNYYYLGVEIIENLLKKSKVCVVESKRKTLRIKIFFIWLQGESDAIIGTTQKEYEK